MATERDRLLEQAELAERYAASRPPHDIKGYVAAMFDARRFRELADQSA
jgi:hypothetical protein